MPVGAIILLVLQLLPIILPLITPLFEKYLVQNKTGQMTGGQTREAIITELKPQLAASPAIPEFVLRIVYEIAFMRWASNKAEIDDYFKHKLADYDARLQAFFNRFKLTPVKYQEAQGFMDLYTKHFDSKD